MWLVSQVLQDAKSGRSAHSEPGNEFDEVTPAQMKRQLR